MLICKALTTAMYIVFDRHVELLVGRFRLYSGLEWIVNHRRK